MKQPAIEITLVDQIDKQMNTLNRLLDSEDRHYAQGYLHGTITSFLRRESKASQKRFLKHVESMVKLNANKLHQQGK